jgi:glycine/D-amino acid oxidase-like deaminating enzyme/nitrite reductase/ring-hydroxylating ferredoxin subunit
MDDDMSTSRHASLWLDDTPDVRFGSLPGDRSFDVAVVGAGITGLTTALLLARAGQSVCVLEQDVVAGGTSGHTTAKVTSQHHLTYARLRRTHGKDGAATYGTAMEAAKERVASLVSEGIDCDFRRRPAYVFSTRPGERFLVDREARAAIEAGLPATIVEDVPLPFPTTGGLRFDDQVELHARKYLLGLAERLVAAGGEIFDGTRALGVSELGESCEVRTSSGVVRAADVVVATLLPFLDRGLYFARAYATRSYVITARVNGALPDAMLISAAPPTRSIRSVRYGDTELLMVGGEGHHVGSIRARPDRYQRLADYAHRHWDVESFEHRWSAQDYVPDDGVPFIGRLNVLSRRIHVATGFKKWGMSSGTLAGMLLHDAITGTRNDWAALFSSTRVKPIAESRRFLTENGRVGFRMVADRLLAPGLREIESLEVGEGAIVSCRGTKVAGYRDGEGALHAVSARCTHLGCQVSWNDAEQSWDCPCHGSRFRPDGSVIEGPAVRPLAPREIPEEHGR